MPLVFHELAVREVRPETDESVSITFEVPPELTSEFSHLPGQHVTVRAEVDGEDVRRSYSICSSANSGVLRVGVKRLPGGKFSTFATTRLRAGDRLGVMPPVGEFTITTNPLAENHYAAVAAGSGITPVLSLVATTLESEPRSRWTVIYGNRAAKTAMFLEELCGLKDRFSHRLHLIHVLSREGTDIPLFSGRIDEEKLSALFDSVVDAATVDEWFLCGPLGMVEAARTAIEKLGVAPALIRDELFFAGPPGDPPPEPAQDEEGAIELSFTLEGRTSSTRMTAESSILDAALRIRRELPYSCKGGMCASCKALLVSGRVEMNRNYALIQPELDQGYILTCQAHPLTGTVEVDFDRR